MTSTVALIADLRKVAGRGPHSQAAWSGLLAAAARLAAFQTAAATILRMWGDGDIGVDLDADPAEFAAAVDALRELVEGT